MVGIGQRMALDRAISWLRRGQYEDGFVVRFAGPLRRIGAYPEITGYAMTTLAGLHRKTGRREFLDRAVMSAHAILGIMRPNGAVPSIIDGRRRAENRVYLFDQAIIARGLLDVSECTAGPGWSGREEIRDRGLAAAEFVRSRSEAGRFFNQYDCDGAVIDRFEYSIFVKANQALLKAHEITGDASFLDCANQVTSYTLEKFQLASGEFAVERGSVFNRTHYHCYAIEGLIEYHRATGDPRAWAGIVDGALVLARHQRPGGGLPNRIFADEDDGVFDVPAVAQALNIWRYAAKTDSARDFGDFIDKAKAFLESCQYRSWFRNVDGGLPFMVPRRLGPRACSWAGLFYIDTFLADPDMDWEGFR